MQIFVISQFSSWAWDVPFSAASILSVWAFQDPIFHTSRLHTASYAEYSSRICFQTICNVTNHASRPASSNSDFLQWAQGKFTLAATEVPYGVRCCAHIIPPSEPQVFNSRKEKILLTGVEILVDLTDVLRCGETGQCHCSFLRCVWMGRGVLFSPLRWSFLKKSNSLKPSNCLTCWYFSHTADDT